MHCLFLLFMLDPLWHLFVPFVVVFAAWRVIMGRVRYAGIHRTLEEEGICLEEDAVLTRMNFPLIHKITFSRLVVTQRRFVLFHSITRGKVLQAPLGSTGRAGKDEGYFEVESRGNKKVLTFRTTLRGGGRIRLHVRNPELWLETITKNQT